MRVLSLLPGVLWLGWVSGCEGSVAASCWLDGNQRQDTSCVQSMGLSTRAAWPPIVSWEAVTHSSVLLLSQRLSSDAGLNWASQGRGARWGSAGGNARGCSDPLQLQLPGSLWPLLGQVEASGCQHCLLVCGERSRRPVLGFLTALSSSSLPAGSPTAQQTSCRTKSLLMLPRARRAGHWSAMPSSRPRRRS